MLCFKQSWGDFAALQLCNDIVHKDNANMQARRHVSHLFALVGCTIVPAVATAGAYSMESTAEMRNRSWDVSIWM